MRRDGPPLTCLVTDRRRLEAGLDGERPAGQRLVDVARQAVAAGADLIQIRERDLDTADLAALVEAIVAIARGSRTRVVVNDRLDVALACGADGVHLRADSIPPARARSIAPPGFLVGRSVHDREEAAAHAAAVDYLIAGTVFPTASKPSTDRLLGVSGLTEIVRAVPVPVLAIGGVTIERVPEIAATGAAGIAGIGLFMPGTMSMADVIDAVRARFDRVKAAS